MRARTRHWVLDAEEADACTPAPSLTPTPAKGDWRRDKGTGRPGQDRLAADPVDSDCTDAHSWFMTPAIRIRD